MFFFINMCYVYVLWGPSVALHFVHTTSSDYTKPPSGHPTHPSHSPYTFRSTLVDSGSGMGCKGTCRSICPVLLNTMSPSSTCLAKNDRPVLFFLVGWRCIVDGEHTFFLHSYADRYPASTANCFSTKAPRHTREKGQPVPKTALGKLDLHMWDSASRQSSLWGEKSTQNPKSKTWWTAAELRSWALA